jgi:RNA polymerase sigma factor (sigma-70 family)
VSGAARAQARCARVVIEYDDRSVAALVEAAGKGDDAAWAALVERFAGLLAAVARTYRLSAADAAEVSQTTWLRLVENLHRISSPERVGGWLATTARRESLRILRLADRQVPISDGFEGTSYNREAHLPVDHDLLRTERDQALRKVFEQLPSRCRLLLLSLVDDPPMSYGALSEALVMPIGSIGPTRGRCLEHLRRLAAEADVTDLLWGVTETAS